ncbi:hypothetical protein [Rhizobium phage RHph_X2_24]|nr:hypothetical protein [Rhizobium phage RHph_X2_24]
MTTPYDTIKAAVLGNPIDPNKEPDRVGVVQAFQEMQVQMDAAQSGALVFGTLAQLTAITVVPSSNIMAWVVNDPTTANNGIYRNTGTALAAVWTRQTDIPQYVIAGINVGAGTVNAIQVTTDLPVPVADGRTILIVPILGANTISPPTVSINGGAALPIVTAAGNNVAIGGLIAGMNVAGVLTNSGTKFRLLSDQASAAIQAAAEAAQAAAEAAASSVNIRNVADRTALKALNTSVSTLAFLKEGSREGFFEWQTGDFSTHIATDTLEGVYIKANDSAATVGAWVRRFTGPVNVEWFGATGDGVTDNTTAFQCAFNVARYASGEWSFIPRGDWIINGGKFTWDTTRTGVRIDGVSMGDTDDGTVIRVTGTPTKVVCTRENWVAAYDSGATFDMVDYSASTDDPIAWLFKFGGYYCQVNNIAIYNVWGADGPNPPTDWGYDYDTAIMPQGRYFNMKNVRIVGAWRRAGLLEDWTQWSLSTDMLYLEGCHIEGRWGYESMGPKSSTDLHANDKRGVGGNSDMFAIQTRFFSIRRNYTPAGGFIRYPAPLVGGVDHAGAMKRSGRAPNTGGRGQGHRFVDCRFHSTSRFITLLDFDSRSEFFGCHWEGQAGFKSDGVTPLDTSNTSGSDFRVELTANSLRTRGFGGEISGIWFQDNQPHLLGLFGGSTYNGGGSIWYGTEMNQRSAETIISVSGGSWTPTFFGTTVAGTPTGTFKGRFIREGNKMTCWLEATLTSKGGATGAVRVDGLPLNAYDIIGDVAIGGIHGVTVPAGYSCVGAIVAVGSNDITFNLNSNTSANGFANLDWSQVADNAVIRLKAEYITEF